MKLKFHWARHLWIDNAQWRVSPKFSSQALKWLRQNYVELELSRPRDRTLKQGTLILFYNEKVDAFGRVCVEISAAFTSWRLLPSAKEEVRPWLERTALDQDATEVEISWLQAMKGARVLQGVGLLLIFAAIVAIGTRVPLETPCESRRYERTVALWNDLVDRFDLDLRQWSECEAIEVIDRVRRLTETFRLPLSRETWSDLDTVERFDPEGVFASYAEFLTELPFTDPPPYRRKSARVQPSIPPISPCPERRNPPPSPTDLDRSKRNHRSVKSPDGAKESLFLRSSVPNAERTMLRPQSERPFLSRTLSVDSAHSAGLLLIKPS